MRNSDMVKTPSHPELFDLHVYKSNWTGTASSYEHAFINTANTSHYQNYSQLFSILQAIYTFSLFCFEE